MLLFTKIKEACSVMVNRNEISKWRQKLLEADSEEWEAGGGGCLLVLYKMMLYNRVVCHVFSYI